jgi:hypothetical protein
MLVIHARLYLNITMVKTDGGITQVVELLLVNTKALSSNPSRLDETRMKIKQIIICTK